MTAPGAGTGWWFPEYDVQREVAEQVCRWRPVLQLGDGVLTPDGPWFATETACADYIREEILPRGGLGGTVYVVVSPQGAVVAVKADAVDAALMVSNRVDVPGGEPGWKMWEAAVEPSRVLVEQVLEAQAAHAATPGGSVTVTEKVAVPERVWAAARAAVAAAPRDAVENARTWRVVYAALRAAGYDAQLPSTE